MSVARLLAALAVDVSHVHEPLGQVLLVLAARLVLVPYQGVGEAGVLGRARAKAPPALGAEELVCVAQRSVAPVVNRARVRSLSRGRRTFLGLSCKSRAT